MSEQKTSSPLKMCSGCAKNLPLGRFNRHVRRKDGRQSRCKSCEKLRDSARDRRAEDRQANLREQGLSVPLSILKCDDVTSCELCGSTSTGSIRSWNKDHCHTTGRIRGWLCTHCNRGLGAFNDSPTKIVQAIRYLGRYGIPLPLEDLQALIEVHHNTHSETPHVATR